ncbi:hypothetical protein AWM75_04110 [Aerococcus urinaehominis]|uniref:Uncharacterized protein n=1 Tax=Aerococcus urinaehominis TaxID=128944 RepID=A0A0X8FL04_9LACT|nr:V-type ATP synthase subunit E [Aerococcus urinaehominis]AMB99240.1 hypothetical protein AWM75_04110 [Aerococcus urinaehominis]SDM31409.1 H+-ATPase subunit E/Vma4 [Aerococcus urinaehominis]
MSSIQALIDQVLENVSAEELAKLQEAQADQQQSLGHAKSQITKRLNQQKDQVKEATQAELQRKEQSYLNEMRNLRLAEQQELLTSVFKAAEDRLTQLPAEEFGQLLLSALSQLASDQPVVVKLGQASSDQLSQQVVNEIRQQFPDIKVDSERLPGQGGFILSQAGMDYNFTFTEILNDLKLPLSATIKKQAFK